jgi:acetyltransferase-like isoleucine patch superfamily enzyme
VNTHAMNAPSVRDRVSGAAIAAPLVRLVRWRRDMWADLRLRLLTDVGYLPSHALRNFFYRRSGVVLPRSSSIHWRAEFYHPGGVVIGENCIIGDSCFLDGRDGITFGTNVNVGGHVSIYTRQHDVDSPSFAETGAPVTVGDRAWIASHAVVLPGVHIGEGAVVAAAAVVTKDVPAFTLVGGNPARVIRERDRNLTYELSYAKRFV